MDFKPSDRAVELSARVAEFIQKEVIPLEEAATEDGLPPEVLRRAREQARARGLWAPQLPAELGGLGLGFLELCPVFEAAGESLLGPLCLGCAAPDEGNAHLLHRAGNAEQQEKYLRPLARGEIRSAFAMTEPAPGAGSDPRMLKARAEKQGGVWVLNGHKWFATGAEGAAFAIVAAVSNPLVPVTEGCTLFIVDAGSAGYEVLRKVAVMGGGTPGGHGEVRLRGCRVPAKQILGGEGNGFRLMQERLGPARLTHCMRWLGAARRALRIAIERARVREAFGKALAEHQAIQWMLADSAMDLHASRLMVLEAAWKIASGDQARVETSMCKAFVAEAVNRVIDRAIQVCGALGLTADLPLARFYQEARAFRIYDGPSEVHRMVVARSLLKTLGKKESQKEIHL
ncbi:MAG: acyl-CoA dehydrogenase family protein [Planctomycetes bacterium]|nr:acyl-CoA dehydrogenase family protein [Planctomycetota bacterium]